MTNSLHGSIFGSFLYAFLLCAYAAVTAGYKPVILVHGLLDGPGQFSSLINFIKEVRDKVHFYLEPLARLCIVKIEIEVCDKI